MLTRDFLVALKMSPTPAYKLAWSVGVHPTWLSQAIHGYRRIQPGDPRLVAIGARLGLKPSQVFAAADSTTPVDAPPAHAESAPAHVGQP